MNTRFPFATGFTACANNTDPYTISGATTFSDDPNGAQGYVDGVEYHYFVRYPDNTTSGHEEGWGAYTASTDSIARTKIGKSSAGYGVKVNWGSSATKHIAAVVSGAELGNMASAVIDLPPWQDVLLGGTSQSNGLAWANLYLTGSALPIYTQVLDWCKIAAGTGSYAWRVTDPTEQSLLLPSDDTVHVGTPRRVDSGGTVYPTGHIGRSAAITLAAFTGRKVRTIFAATVGTAIDAAVRGWWPYNASLTTGCAKIFKDAVGAAVAQMVIDDPRQTATKLHICMHAQGESDISKTSGQYGFMLADVIQAYEDTTRWNICDSNTIYLLYDIPPQLRESSSSGLKFDGHRVAAYLIGERAHVVDTKGALTAEGLHYTGASADMLGPRGIKILLTSSRSDIPASPAFLLKRDVGEFGASYVMDTTGAGAPTAPKFKLNTALTALRIRNIDFLGVDYKALGMSSLKAGDVLRFVKSGQSGANYKTITLTGPPIFNTDDIEWPISTPVDTGTVPVAGDTAAVTSLVNKIFDGVTYTAITDAYIQSSKRAAGTELAITLVSEGRENKVLGVNTDGRDTRSRDLIPFYNTVKTTTNAATTLLNNYGLADGASEYIDVIVAYKILTSHRYGQFRIQCIARRTGAAVYFDSSYTVTTLQDPEGLGPPAIASDNFFSVIWGWKVTHGCKAATTIHWTTKAYVTPLFTSP